MQIRQISRTDNEQNSIFSKPNALYCKLCGNSKKMSVSSSTKGIHNIMQGQNKMSCVETVGKIKESENAQFRQRGISDMY